MMYMPLIIVIQPLKEESYSATCAQHYTYTGQALNCLVTVTNASPRYFSTLRIVTSFCSTSTVMNASGKKRETVVLLIQEK